MSTAPIYDRAQAIQTLCLQRQRARTDLIWLCRHVLKYADVSRDPHLEIANNLQRFDGGEDVLDDKLRVVAYKPKTLLWDLPGPKKTLTLFPRGHLKALDVDTEIPTPTGFTKMVDLQVGDKVFAQDGNACMVKAISEVVFSASVYEIEFSTGDSIVCDSDHLWLTDCRRDRDNHTPRRNMPSVKTTRDIASSVMIRDERNHRVTVNLPIDTDKAELLIPPYSLGAWLGDGTSLCGQLTCNDSQILDEIRAEGEPIRKANAKLRYTFGDSRTHKSKTLSFHSRLRALGVLGNKHIPREYMRASAQQRLSIVQGLMDTDGSVSKDGQCFFTNTNRGLVTQLRELVCSLGIKPSYVYSWDAMLRGKNCGKCYTISFYPRNNEPVFRLSRKLLRLKQRGRVSLQDYRQIVSVKEVAPRFVKCISVDSKDGLFLVGRGFIPTHNSTIATIAHSIQWIVNYPNIRIHLESATLELVYGFGDEIRKHFQYNENFRYLFPEFCPSMRKASDWGNREGFSVPNRTIYHKEPTLSVGAVGKVVAGPHYEVVICDDLVDKENVRTKEQIMTVNSHFGYLWPLLETAKDSSGKIGWMNVVGTRYDFSDLYGLILKSTYAQSGPVSPDPWGIVMRAAVNHDKEGKRFALWPVGMPLERLDKLRLDPTMGSSAFNAQYNQNPKGDGQGLIDVEQIVYIPRSELNNLRARLREHVTIDLAGMENISKTNDTDYTAIVHAGFDTDGRLYILNVLHGRFTQSEIIEHIFDLYARNTRIVDFKIQKDHLALGFLPTLQRERIKRQKFPLIVPMKIDNQNSKINRIKGLQPWFESGNIRFAQDLACKNYLEDEIQYFPKYAHDDILDAIADQLQNRDGEVIADVNPAYDAEPQRTHSLKNPDGSMTLLGTPAERMGNALWGERELEGLYDAITGW